MGDGAAEEQGERGRRRGQEGEEGEFCVRLSRERDCTMVGPLYRDPRPAAQLLISSTAHQSLVHDPPSRKVSLSLSLPAPISQPQTWPYPSRAISRTPMAHEARRKEGGWEGESRTRLFMLRDSSSPPGVKLMKTEGASRKGFEI